ncbi:SDR family oxidoreductase [Kitasatospora sp. NPDC002227]|uniref:SDR family oxidoreductase n=1 Tax=Kitasatospora sp. NPDC002227 TaxID=3154773 RepID=UPI003316D468
MRTTSVVTEDELAAYEALVARLRAMPADQPLRMRAEKLAEVFVREGRRRRRGLDRAQAVAADSELAAATVTGALDRPEDVPLALPATAAPVGSYRRAHKCYVCKGWYREVHGFYHSLCPACAVENADWRALGTDLRGRRALLTGGRVKIGFQLALMLLRDGAELIITSRFPQDALRRFHAEPGSGEWLHRLTVVGIDLRDPRQVLGLCEQLVTDGRPLDILINNAAQTVRRPPEAYAVLTAGERGALPAQVALAPGYRPSLELASPNADLAVLTTESGLLPDTEPVNSWSARLGEIDPAELLETQLVNSVAPALLCDRLLPLLLSSPQPRRYIVNVTAVEGRFAVRNKTGGHPHTNMAKAALNMLTRTSAAELAVQGVYMCAVDTGWITDENPAPRKARIAAKGFRPPLDTVDGAARIYHPIVRGEAGEPIAGVFLKDYQEAEW